MTINNITDLAEHFGTEVDRLKHDLYKYTACGAWITWNEDSFMIGSIVEGSDAEFQKQFLFPVDSEKVDLWMDDLEILTDEAWHEANDDETDE